MRVEAKGGEKERDVLKVCYVIVWKHFYNLQSQRQWMYVN